MILGIFLAALMEYLLHRIYLHQPKHGHIVEHHKIFLKQFENPQVALKDIASKPAYVFTSSLLALIAALIMMIFNPVYAVIIYVSAIFYLIWVEYSHYLFHSPKGYKLEQFTFFKILKEHHHVHHIKFNVNYGIGSSFMDIVLKTKLK